MNRGKGMGMGMGHGRKGGPPGLDRNDPDAELDLPVEAFVACEGKSSGDIVEFSNPDGDVVRATCMVIDDHLVAVPEQKSGNSNRG